MQCRTFAAVLTLAGSSRLRPVFLAAFLSTTTTLIRDHPRSNRCANSLCTSLCEKRRTGKIGAPFSRKSLSCNQ